MATKNTNTGTVKFFNEIKKFGFIVDDTDLNDDKGQKEYFVHFTDTLDIIHTNDKVAYDIEMGQRGLKAVKVKKIKE